MTHWRDLAACLNHNAELWFPLGERSDADRANTAAAKAICGSPDQPACPVREACLAEAMRVETGHGRDNRNGVQGGLTASARHHLSTKTSKPVPACGTSGGALQHRKRGEDPCVFCAAAFRAHRRQWKAGAA